LGISEAVLGSLYETGRLSPGCQIESTPGLMLECEIGVIIDSNQKPIFLVPVIEIVFLKYTNPSDLNAVNIVAANVGADRFICGEPQPWDSNGGSTDLLLTKDGETVCQASTGDSLEGPAKGLAWMIQQAHNRQFEVKEGMLFILGTCGPPVQADKGEYLASYGELGNIAFTVL
jgi:2-keto-4-pentenoate hydratase